MASSLSWLHSCKVSQLKAIAHLTGLNSTGTKPVVTARLLQHLPHSLFSGPNTQSPRQTPTRPTTIISIDMGIRNLAYCRLTLPPASAGLSAPLLTDWTRVAISRPSAAMESTAEKEPFDPATYSQHAYALIATLLFPETPSHILIERQRFRSLGGSAVLEWTLRVNMFEAMLYAVLATLAARGIWKGTVHAVPPAKVAALWVGERDEAELGDARKGGRRRNEEISAPDEHDEIESPKGGKKKPTKSQRTKTRKIKLVYQWLNQTPQIIQLQPNSPAAQMAEAYVNKSRGRSGGGGGGAGAGEGEGDGGGGGDSRKKTKTPNKASSLPTSLPTPTLPTSTTASTPKSPDLPTTTPTPPPTTTPPPPGLEKLNKLDDLADCLLQGMAWIQWERNRARILAGGVSGFAKMEREREMGREGG